jgi:hypothetical protein
LAALFLAGIAESKRLCRSVEYPDDENHGCAKYCDRRHKEQKDQRGSKTIKLRGDEPELSQQKQRV